jgi:hypothetical protein
MNVEMQFPSQLCAVLRALCEKIEKAQEKGNFKESSTLYLSRARHVQASSRRSSDELVAEDPRHPSSIPIKGWH